MESKSPDSFVHHREKTEPKYSHLDLVLLFTTFCPRLTLDNTFGYWYIHETSVKSIKSSMQRSSQSRCLNEVLLTWTSFYLFFFLFLFFFLPFFTALSCSEIHQPGRDCLNHMIFYFKILDEILLELQGKMKKNTERCDFYLHIKI